VRVHRLRLPILSTLFGARGLHFEDGETGFVFEPEVDGLAPALARVRRLFDEDRGRLRQIAAAAYARNERRVDMNACVQPLAEAIGEARERQRTMARATLAGARPVPESV